MNQSASNYAIYQSPRHGMKAIYISLCALLGAMLLVVLQRALFLIYILLLNTDYERYSLGLTAYTFRQVDFVTLSLAVILGLWYGIWLGLHWYHYVYEMKNMIKFKQSNKVKITDKTYEKSQDVRAEISMPSLKQVQTSSQKESGSTMSSWSFDDLLSFKEDSKKQAEPVEIKTVKKKKIVKKKLKPEPEAEESSPKPKKKTVKKRKVTKKKAVKKIEKS